MDLLPSPEQAEIANSARSFLAAEVPMTAVRANADRPGVDRDVWARVGALGWFGLGLDEASGGVGYGLPEEVLLFREIGRFLAPGPFVASALAARVAAAAGESTTAGAIVEGRAVVGLAEPFGDRYRLLDATHADLVLTVDADGAALTERSAWGDVEPAVAMDPTVELAYARAPDGPPIVVAIGRAVAERGAVLTAAMLVGTAEATRDMSAQYAKDREQFGKPIGTFQAVKHRCADMAVRCEVTLDLTIYAALLFDAGSPDAPLHVAAAKALAGEYAIANAFDNVQNHGGIGVTWEHDAHLFVKRAHVAASTFGGRTEQLASVLAAPAAS
ncbi:MAG TPA: acyl-CoA dehydrogenase family protein [Acidimicrobiales bacterium]